MSTSSSIDIVPIKDHCATLMEKAGLYNFSGSDIERENMNCLSVIEQEFQKSPETFAWEDVGALASKSGGRPGL